jgi:hypothetical protein
MAPVETFPISAKDPNLMAVIAILSTQTLLWDFSDSEAFFILVIPPELTKQTLFSVTVAYAAEWMAATQASSVSSPGSATIICNPFLGSNPYR